MLLLHTADLHLGKTIRDRDILEDQARALDAMLDAVTRERPAALLVAGDVFDRSIPPPEAVGLFDSFLCRAVAASPGMAVVVVPGNHDSAARLSFGASLLRLAGVHLRTRAEDCVEPVVVERDGERAAIWALPFLGPGAFAPRGDASSARAGAEAPASSAPELPFDEPEGAREARPAPASQAELFERAMGMIGGRLLPDSRNVLLAHCFAAGGAASESERAFVGASEQVDASLADRFDYAAYGHLHRFQPAGSRGRYSGSPLAYSFAEGEEDKGFVLVELGSGGARTELVRITPLRPMRRIEGPFAELSAPGARPECREAFVEARLTDPEPVLNPADPLRANFPNLLAVRQAAFELAAGRAPAAEAAPDAGQGPAAVAADFAAFHERMRGEPPDAASAALFGRLLEEAGHEAL